MRREEGVPGALAAAGGVVRVVVGLLDLEVEGVFLLDLFFFFFFLGAGLRRREGGFVFMNVFSSLHFFWGEGGGRLKMGKLDNPFFSSG